GGALRRRPKALRRARRRRRRPDGGVMPIGPTPTSGLRVLVVDDEPGIRRLIQTSLKGWGYEVVAASTGEEALAILESDAAPSLAILDWTMPGMDGLELCRRVHGLLPICSYCKKVRDDQNYWQQVESYIEGHSEAQFTHGICPECRTKYVEPELERLRQQRLSGE